MVPIEGSEVIEGLGLKPKPQKQNLIMVLGVGGAGGNAVNHMYDMGITDVTFMLCNTDRQALAMSPVPTKVQLGEGLGAGNDPIKAKQAALESLDDIVVRFEQEGTKMVFITAGMGGGTGTGAAPVIAKAAHDKGLLTVGIVTLPFRAEGRKRIDQAARGLEELKNNVDSLVVIHNDNISKIYGSLPLEEAFGKADDVLAIAAKTIAELITRSITVNVDFADVTAVMKNSGMALMGAGHVSGDEDLLKIADEALSSPLLNHQDIKGAKNVLVSLTYSPRKLSVDQTNSILEYIQKKASKNFGDMESANIIWGAGVDKNLDDEIRLTIVATGFDTLDPLSAPGGSDKGPKNIFTDISRQQSSVIKVGKKERFANIEKYLETPSYIRRNIRLSNAPGSTKSAKVLKDDIEPEQPQTPPENTLF